MVYQVKTKDLDKVFLRVSERINETLRSGEVHILNHTTQSDSEFKSEFKSVERVCTKKLKKFLKNMRKYYGYPLKVIEEFEYIIGLFEVCQVWDADYVQEQRERLYREMNSPDEFKHWIEYAKKEMYESIEDRV